MTLNEHLVSSVELIPTGFLSYEILVSAPLLRALTSLPEDPGLIPRIHIVTHKYQQLQFQGI